jgi:hypothetical protein
MVSYSTVITRTSSLHTHPDVPLPLGSVCLTTPMGIVTSTRKRNSEISHKNYHIHHLSASQKGLD